MRSDVTTMNEQGFKRSLAASAVLHFLALLFLYFGLPYLMPPLPEHHEPVPLQIVELAELTNTKLKEEEPKPPAPEPPKAQPKPEQAPPPPPPVPAPPVPAPPVPPAKPEQPQAEALQAAPVPKPKPKPPEETKPQTDDFAKLLKNLETKKTEAPKVTETKSENKTQAQPVSQASALSDRLTISEEDALRRQIEGCWNAPVGARDAQNLVVEIVIDVNPDRTVMNAEMVDKGRYASDSFYRAAADSAIRAVRNPKCSPLLLPEGKYEQWKRINFTFDPRDML